MQTRRMTISVIVAFVALPGLWVCAPTAGQTITPIDQGRFVSTESLNAPQCGPDFLFDDEAAIGFDPFDAFVQTQHGCDSGFAGSWGPCANCGECPADLDGDCTVGMSDLLVLLANWG